MKWQCPICGFNRLEEPAEDFSICPCCGTEFGFDDFEMSHAELSQQWIEKGCFWWGSYTNPPDNWNPREQLESAGIFVFDETPATESSQGTAIFYNEKIQPIAFRYGNIRIVSVLLDVTGTGASRQAAS